MMQWRSTSLILITVIFLAAAVSGCSSAGNLAESLELAPLEGMPAEVQEAPATVRQAYQFAAANPEVLSSIPCYCGCGSMGHTSNYACYVSGTDENGSTVFDAHALACSICVDITQDVMRLLREGKSPQEARAYIDSTYAKYGPSNIP